jgi:hypothetical protein
VSDRNDDPEPHPLVVRLTSTGNDVEDVISLVGFVGLEADGNRRIFADAGLQRYLDIPATDLIHAEELPEEEGGRMRVYVRREAMNAAIFDDGTLEALEGKILGARMSTWQFLPENRIVAAEVLGLLPRAELWRYEEEEAPS